MESLPIELLTLICEYLKLGHPPSLISFALTSKQFYAAATKELFRNIRFRINCYATLKSDVAGYLHALKTSGSLKHVRQLTICDFHAKNQRIKKNDRRLTLRSSAHLSRPNTVQNENVQRKESRVSWQDLKGPFLGDPFAEDWLTTPDQPPEGSVDRLLTPLTTLIQQLPCLALVQYKCGYKIPKCLLRCLENRPNAAIKLRVHSNCSVQFESHAADVTFSDHPVLSSPLLTCVSLYMDPSLIAKSGRGRFLATISPALKEMKIFGPSLSHPPQYPSALMYQGQEVKKIPLQVLRLADASLIYGHGRRLLEAWYHLVDFAALKVLDLQFLRMDNQTLAWAVATTPFSALTDLEVGDEISARITPSFQLHYTAEAFLLSLHPLQRLSMRGIPKLARLHAVLKHHGPSLRQLHFRPATEMNRDYTHTYGKAMLIRRFCPSLQHLTFHMPRSTGNRHEVTIYQVLGRLPRLIRLDLTLDAFVPFQSSTTKGGSVLPPTPPDDEYVNDKIFFKLPFDGERDSALLNGHVRDSFVNSAIDSKLAKRVFQIISCEKTPQDSPLQFLSIRIIGAGTYFLLPHDKVLYDMGKELAHSYVVTLSPRDDQSGMLVTTEIVPTDEFRVGDQLPVTLDDRTERVFRRIWPKKGNDPRYHWESLPLDEGPSCNTRSRRHKVPRILMSG